MPRPPRPIELPRGARMALMAPDALTRTLAAVEEDPERRWLLSQPRAVRRTFVEQVVDRQDDPRAHERWLLLQDDAVRRSFVDQVLDGRG
jgi:hypothetical protein